MKITARLLATAALAGTLLAGPALAGPLTWTLSNVTFDDGGTASGSFTYDADTNTLNNWAITTTGGSTLGGATYDSVSNPYGFTLSNADFFFGANGSLNPYLRLGTTSGLTNAGGTVALLTGFSSYECTNCGAYRLVTGGSVTTGSVPEPAAWAMMVAGFGLVGFAARRQKARVSFAA